MTDFPVQFPDETRNSLFEGAGKFSRKWLFLFRHSAPFDCSQQAKLAKFPVFSPLAGNLVHVDRHPISETHPPASRPNSRSRTRNSRCEMRSAMRCGRTRPIDVSICHCGDVHQPI